ncbi:phospholipase D1-like isoform X1 [Kryptolebias marmoratus]|uniref:Phospholipase n=1 Tax=Kryptolebias marmoratus TaxID=37003 RepID=A0A3Q3G368_KRYMA|nr:phospholipase D1-like isoform X1 [Kryptolebias marmoratus]XP_037835077.1 phospholipase D1-like isoform X1 [Kryptolebias marmoratus]
MDKIATELALKTTGHQLSVFSSSDVPGSFKHEDPLSTTCTPAGNCDPVREAGSSANSAMAIQEDGIKPAAASSAAQSQGGGKGFWDIIIKKKDEIDALILENQQSFRSIHHLKNRPFIMLNTPITCEMTNVEKKPDALDDEDTLYTFDITHGQFHWTVKKKYKHFQELQRDLHFHRLLLPFQRFDRFNMNVQRRRSILEEMPSLQAPGKTKRISMRGAPECHDSKHLEEYLNCVLKKTFCKKTSCLMEFLCVSRLSFIPDLGPKGLEGPVIKRSGGYHTSNLQCISNNTCCFLWLHRWMVVKDSFLMFINRDNSTINGVMLFDQEFKVDPVDTNNHHGICIKNTARSLVIQCSSDEQKDWWSQEINKMAEACDFLKEQRFGGFAPPRANTLTKWYVNGSGYFADLADALENAKEEIFITDWWLSPKVFLKRPANKKEWRLDKILQKKAEEGVKVFVLLYREVTYALSINSDYSKRALRKKHRNIKVIRHPDHILSGVVFWAHHEKMVAIDQSVAFVGGIDLTLGRWDDNEYRLTDLGSTEESNGVTEEQPDKGCLCCQTDASDTRPNSQPKWSSKHLADNTKLWLGKDYNNFVEKDWFKPDKPFEENVDRTKVPRIPWRDLSAAVHGRAARDVARHFIQRWNLNKLSKRKYRNDSFPYLVPKSNSTADSLPYTVTGSSKAKVQVLRSFSDWLPKMKVELSIKEAYIDTIEKSEHYIYIENQFFITCADGVIENEIGDVIVKRILRAHREQKKFRVFVVIPLSPGFEGDIKTASGNAARTILHYTYRTINRGKASILSRLSEQIENWTEYITFCGLRTHSKLSGKLVTEQIYVHSKTLIADDRRYIIGSANINDRSMLGNRDTELAVLVEDEERVPSVMGGQEYEAGPLTLALRKECFSVLLGANDEPRIDIDDPISDAFFGVWQKTTELNTEIYEKVFKCPPCDNVHNMQQLREYNDEKPLSETDSEQAEEELKAVRGLLVHFPLNYLCEENLLPPLICKEGMAPSTVWT